MKMSEVWSAVAASSADFAYKDAWTLSMFSIMTPGISDDSLSTLRRAPTKLRANSAAIKRLI